MDIEATYRKLAALAGDIVDENWDPADAEEHAVQLAEWFDALDIWLRKGGFLPGSWER